jgi:hypothetical protein
VLGGAEVAGAVGVGVAVGAGGVGRPEAPGGVRAGGAAVGGAVGVGVVVGVCGGGDGGVVGRTGAAVGGGGGFGAAGGGGGGACRIWGCGGGGVGLGGGAAPGGGPGCGAAAGGAPFGGALGSPFGGPLGLPSGPTSPCACATTIDPVCACDGALANCIAVRAVVASSAIRKFVMMISVPEKASELKGSLSRTLRRYDQQPAIRPECGGCKTQRVFYFTSARGYTRARS